MKCFAIHLKLTREHLNYYDVIGLTFMITKTYKSIYEHICRGQRELEAREQKAKYCDFEANLWDIFGSLGADSMVSFYPGLSFSPAKPGRSIFYYMETFSPGCVYDTSELFSARTELMKSGRRPISIPRVL